MWRSLVARLNGVQEAGSSNLLTQTKRAIDSVGRVPPSHGGSQGFESLIAHQKGLIRTLGLVLFMSNSLVGFDYHLSEANYHTSIASYKDEFE